MFSSCHALYETLIKLNLFAVLIQSILPISRNFLFLCSPRRIFISEPPTLFTNVLVSWLNPLPCASREGYFSLASLCSLFYVARNLTCMRVYPLRELDCLQAESISVSQESLGSRSVAGSGMLHLYAVMISTGACSTITFRPKSIRNSSHPFVFSPV